jgi:hypothetical protein
MKSIRAGISNLTIIVHTFIPVTLLTYIDVALHLPTVNSGYFSQAEQQLRSPPWRRHSIVPRLTTTAKYEDDQGGIASQLTSTQPPSFPAVNSGAAREKIPRGISLRSGSPVHDLKLLTRRTSQEFGTTYVRPRVRMPSLSFNPPFMKPTNN